MKVTWEIKDIEVGRIVRSSTEARNRNFIVTYAVGFGGNTYGLVYLADGQVVVSGMTRGQVADYLNEGGHLPTEDDRDVIKAADVLRGVS